MDDLEGKIALVTGGGSGISFAFVKILVQSGCRVLIADLALHANTQIWLESLGEPVEAPARFHQVDVTDWAQLEKVFKNCTALFGTPDIVVPGAGVYEPSHNSFWNDRDQGGHYKVLDINLIHPIKTTRLAIREMVKAGKKQGVVLHLSSIAGQRSSLATPLYTASKHGINSFVRGMGSLKEVVGISVFAVAPGNVSTPLWTEHPEATKLLDIKNDFLLSPDDVARAMFSLVIDKKYKSGTILEVCDPTQWREVELLNDAGPQGPGSRTASRKAEALKDIMQFLGLKHEDAKLLGKID